MLHKKENLSYTKFQKRKYNLILVGIMILQLMIFTAFTVYGGDYGTCRNRNYNFDGNYTYPLE